MNLIQEIYRSAELALAAYTAIQSTITINNKQLLIDAGFSDKQAEEFAKRYPTVVTQYTDPSTSFTATVFKDTAGNLTLAIRGTLEPRDYVTDVDIALAGAGYDQLVSMYNWWQRVSNPAGENVSQFQIKSYENSLGLNPPVGAIALYTSGSITTYLGPAASVTSTGELTVDIGADVNGKLNVTGHSLGGHLAMAFGSLFPDMSGQITVFNAPGFKATDTNTAFFGRLGGSIPTGVNTINVIAAEANVGSVPWNAVAGLHGRPGEAIDISIENQASAGEPGRPSALNHSQMVLTDALAVYSVLAKLDPTLTQTTFQELLGAMDNVPYRSLERLVDGLERVFGVNNTELPLGNPQRDALYKALYSLQENTSFQLLQDRVEIVAAPTDGLTAKTDFGALLSLVHLIPFSLKPNDSVASTILESANSALAAQWYEDRDSSDVQNVAGSKNFSDEYLADRGAMLSWIVKRNQEDDTRTTKDGPDVLFRDVASQTEIRLGSVLVGDMDRRRILFGGLEENELSGGSKNDRIYGGGGNDTIDGGQSNDYIEGNAGSDTLRGGAGGDILLGGDGNDTLDGGAGNDILKGGADFDIYTFTSGHGADTIIDSDGSGAIRIDGVILEGGKETAKDSGVWHSDDERFRFMLVPEADGSKTLIIRRAEPSSDRIYIKNFSNDGLGIALRDAEAAVNPEPVLAFLGDLAAKDMDLDEPGVQSGHDAYGNLITDPNVVEAGKSDDLFGSADNDRIEGRGGNDRLSGKEGDDTLDGGEGDDLLHGDEGRDVLVGGAGSDILLGGAGNDRLYADEEIDMATALERQNAEASGQRGSFLAGGEGDDVLIGHTGNDVLFGGAGRDVIAGGAGDDIISGDMDAGFVSLFWSAQLAGMDAGGSAYLVDYQGVELRYDGAGDDDVIHAGAGNDLVNGLAGDDYIDGGPGDDLLFGGLGNDILLGGTQDDQLFGNQGNDYLDGQGGDDYLQGGQGDDVLLGGAGKDQLYGHEGDDYLEGGTGEDVLAGGVGDDTYAFNRGDGQDELFDLEGRNTVIFGAGISQSSLKFKASGGMLAIEYGDGDSLLVNGAVDHYRFADGSSVSAVELLNRLQEALSTNGSDEDNLLAGGGGGDVISGHGGNDVIHGGAGGDRLLGGDGFDVLHGGKGSDLLFGEDGSDVLYGGDGTDMLAGGAGDDAVHGGNGDDLLWGQAGADTLHGDDGDDDLMPGDGDDVLEGGRGNDVIWGGSGRKTYLFGPGDGNDVVHTVDGERHIVFSEGVAPSDIKVYLSPAGMPRPYTVVQYGDQDSVTILSGGGVLDYAFSDGTLLTHAELVSLAKQSTSATRMLFGSAGNDNLSAGLQAASLYGGSGTDLMHGSSFNDVLKGGADNDSLFGNNGDDVLLGGTGDDILEGGNGNDTLAGGEGWDTLRGGAGSDTYLYARGDGRDQIIESADGGGDFNTLRFADIASSEVRFTRKAGGNLKIEVVGSDDAVEIQGWYSNPATRLQQIVFSDGSVLGAAALDDLEKEKIIGEGHGDALTGTMYSDIIVGTDGNDLIDGAAGDDLMHGGKGADTYQLRRGMGLDVIHESGEDVNRLKLGAEAAFADLIGERRADDLYVHFNGARDGVLLKNYYGTPQSWEVVSSGGEVMSLDAALAEAGSQPVPTTVEQLREAWFVKVKTRYLQKIIDDQNKYGNEPYQQTGPFVLTVGDKWRTTYSFTETTQHSNQSYIQRASDGWGDPGYTTGTLPATLTLPTVRFGVQLKSDGSTTITDYGGLSAEGGVTTYSISAQGTLIGNSELALWPYLFGEVQADGTVALSVATPITSTKQTMIIEHIKAGSADNVIFLDDWGSADAGAGNDFIWAGRASANEVGGHFLYGGAGDDFIVNGFEQDIVIGGDGNDYLAGGMGNDTYYLIAKETGIKIIDEAADLWRVPEAAIYDGMLTNHGSNYSDKDVAEFGPGAELASMSIRKGKYQSPYDLTAIGYQDDERVYETLDFFWGRDQGARVLLFDPSQATTSQYGDNGIEYFRFSDGTTFTLQEMLAFVEARSYLAADLWPGDGIQTLAPQHGINTIRFGHGIDSKDIQVLKSGDDIVFVHTAGTERWTIEGMRPYWRSVSAHFADGSRWSELPIDGEAEVITGTAGEDSLTAPDDSGYIFAGGPGADTLSGGAGDDTYIFNIGDGIDTIIDEGGRNVIQFGPGITPDMVSLGLGSLLLRVGDEGDQIHIEGFDAANALGSGHVQVYRFADGSELSHEQLLSRGLDIHGTEGADVLSGTNITDRINGGLGDDTLNGGPGNDILLGGEGDDRYVFHPGDGADRIVDNEGDDSLHVSGGLTKADLHAERVGDDLVITVLGVTDSITLEAWFAHDQGVNRIVFDGGTGLNRPGIAGLMNRPPVAVTDVVTVYEDGSSLEIPVTQLLANDTAPNPGDTLSVLDVGPSELGAAVSLQNGTLHYDIGDRFQELAAGQIKHDHVIYTVSDSKGAKANGILQVEIVGTNDVPVVRPDFAFMREDAQTPASGNVLSNDSDVDAGTVLHIVSPGIIAGQYGDLSIAEDGSYTYSLNNGAENLRALGRGELVVEQFAYAVTDGIEQIASTLEITVSGTNDAPVQSKEIDDITLKFNKSFTWKLPDGTFADPDTGDTLKYTATLADGSPLPSWLHFDADTQTFYGKAPSKIEVIDVKVRASDRAGENGSDENSLSTAGVFQISVSHVNQGKGNDKWAAAAYGNDGPAVVPGNPGEKGHSKDNDKGKHKKFEIQESGEDDVPGKWGDKQHWPAYLKPNQWEQHVVSGPSIGNTTSAHAFAQWLAMEQMLSAALADKKGGDRLGNDDGVDIAALGKAASGFLNSTTTLGGDPVSLGAVAGHNLKTFKGLGKGLADIAG